MERAGDSDTNENRIPTRKLFLIGLVIGLIATPIVVAALTNTTTINNGVPLSAGSGPTVTVTGNTEIDLTTPFPDANTVEVTTSDGNITFTSNGATSATIKNDNITGKWTNVTGLDVTSNELKINPEDKDAINVSGDTDRIAYRKDMRVADEKVDFVYAGSSGSTTVTLRGLSPNINVVATDGTGTTLTSARTNSEGVVTLSNMPNSEHVVTLEAQSSPYVDSHTPETGEYIDNRDVDLNATVVDPRGDNFDKVTIQVYNGSWTTVATETDHPSNTEINASITAEPTGNTWRVVMNATGNRNVTSANFTYRTPGFVTIYEHQNNSIAEFDAITGELNSTESDYSDSLTTSDGTADLATINPPDEIHQSNWSGGDFEPQPLVINDPAQNTSVVLYNASVSETYTQCFTLDDVTGTFTPANSWVVTEEYVNGSWVTVGSDYFGPNNNAEIALSDGEDYRIRVRNEDGDMRVLGPHPADSSDSCIKLSIESSIGDPDDPATVQHNATCVDAGNTNRVKFNYSDDHDATTEIYLQIYEYQNQSNTLLDNTTFSGTFGTFSYTANVPLSENDTTWVVEFTTARGSESTIRGRSITCGQKEALGGMASWLVTFFFVSMMWLVAGLFSQLNGHIGGLAVAGLGGMFYLAGFVPSGLGVGVVILAMITAAVLFIRERGGQGL